MKWITHRILLIVPNTQWLFNEFPWIFGTPYIFTTINFKLQFPHCIYFIQIDIYFPPNSFYTLQKKMNAAPNFTEYSMGTELFWFSVIPTEFNNLDFYLYAFRSIYIFIYKNKNVTYTWQTRADLSSLLTFQVQYY